MAKTAEGEYTDALGNGAVQPGEFVYPIVKDADGTIQFMVDEGRFLPGVIRETGRSEQLAVDVEPSADAWAEQYGDGFLGIGHVQPGGSYPSSQDLRFNARNSSSSGLALVMVSTNYDGQSTLLYSTPVANLPEEITMPSRAEGLTSFSEQLDSYGSTLYEIQGTPAMAIPIRPRLPRMTP